MNTDNSNKIANVHVHMIHDFLSSPHSPSQTAAQSVQPFLHGLCHILIVPPYFIQIFALAIGRSGLPSIRGRKDRVVAPGGRPAHSRRSTVFAGWRQCILLSNTRFFLIGLTP